MCMHAVGVILENLVDEKLSYIYILKYHRHCEVYVVLLVTCCFIEIRTDVVLQ